MLKWENKNDAYGNYFSADTGIGGEYVIQLYTDEVIGLLDEHAELFYIAASTVDEVKVACEADYARRVTEIAAANGYVKVDPPITSMHDPRLGIKKPEPWHIDVDALAKSAGYVKLEPGQVVVQREDIAPLVDFWFGAPRLVALDRVAITSGANRIRAALDASGVGR